MNLTPLQTRLLFGIGFLFFGLLGGNFRWKKLKKRDHPFILEVFTEILDPGLLPAALLIVVGLAAIFVSLREVMMGS